MGDSGYSGTPLARKLGLKAGQAALLLGTPPDMSEITGFAEFLRCETSIDPAAGRSYDYVHVFETQRSVLDELAPEVAARLKSDGILWISWPKKASRVPTTLTEDVLLEIFLPLGLVDVKVCAVDAVWSGLKFMFRKELRDRLS
ncbi:MULTISPECIES: hypothetical protein [unclassified Ensifer]|uniref:hypothetical protein n=1 Tax=unclassified Ensifer TaxID=2633371 RepID=UPI000812F0FB|nr:MULTISPECIES: hypothetical protein [unclassified Ensifer]OCP09234.1 hypothetical protein BC374_01280 [Ensifer sp. LC13]OCP10421.1 hypothetical protein BBX50_01630 [Ensifer sp. LC11]OCP13978.1 hypothetical protein BC362_04325 [Ensifer sp. LC14]OCP32482.1 hypothetical protein BC364_01280 [Ensifer sp. LC499]